MKHGSLFSGIGGFDLAAEWMGWQNVFHCEMNPFGQRVLAHHFPNSKLHEDVTTFPASDYARRIDILTGGFPCQPYSMAGKRKGKEDERHLWPAMLEVIRGIQPRWVVGENVRGLVNWNDGLVFEEVCADLEVIGYSVQPFILPAAAVNAPHRRDRVWFVAHANGSHDGRAARKDASESGKERIHQRNAVRQFAEPGEVQRNATNTEGIRRKNPLPNRKLEGRRFGERSKSSTWDSFPSQPPICGGDDGLPAELDGITFSKWRNESIKAYGNAIVPQVTHQIFQAIQQYEDGKNTPNK